MACLYGLRFGFFYTAKHGLRSYVGADLRVCPVLGDVHGVGATLRGRPDELHHHRNEKKGNHIGLPLQCEIKQGVNDEKNTCCINSPITISSEFHSLFFKNKLWQLDYISA
jgi:hypothetical protein